MTGPQLGPPAGMYWRARVHKHFDLVLRPEIGVAARARSAQAAALTLTPALPMAATSRSFAAFDMALSPSLAMERPPPSAAALNLALSSAVGMSAVGKSVAGFDLGLTPAIGMTGVERYARGFDLGLTPAIGMTGAANNPAALVRGVNVSATSSVTIPAHSVGDIIVIYAFYASAGSSNPLPPTPSGTVPAWAGIDPSNAGANQCASGTWSFVATATNHTSGTWQRTQYMAAAVLSGQGSTPIGGHAEAGGLATGSDTAPAVTLINTDGTSVLLHFFSYAASVSWSAAPTGYTLKNSNAQICVDTKDDTTSDGAVTHANNAGSSHGYRGATVEIRSH